MYKKFSDLYDELVFDIDYEFYLSNIKNILNDYNIEKPDILEIACGTGNLTKHLSGISNSVLAFDYSEQMLNHAYNKLIDYENVNIIKQDMYKFPYESYSFDAIITLLDVINYIHSEEKVIDLFKNIYKGLGDGGVFIFDLNSKYKLFEVLGDNHFVYERNNIFYTWESSVEGNFIYFDLNFFVRREDGLYERIIENQVERYYSINKIVKILKNIGFKDIKFIDEDTGEKYIEGETQRILFSAVK